MTSFHQFVTELLREGKVVFRSAQAPRDRPRPEDIALLEKAFEAVQLSVAGPTIPFDTAVGYSAAELLRQASWALLNHDDRISQLKKLIDDADSSRRLRRITSRPILCCVICRRS